MDNTSIVAAGDKFDIGCRVILWNEPNGFSFYKNKNLYYRNISLNELRKQLTCFVVHYAVTYRARGLFNGLNARNLSANFLIDDDINDYGCATIYQCADIKDAGWTHGPLNRNGAGVEISYHPQAWSHPYLYSISNQKLFKVQPHNIVSDEVHGMKFSKVFAPTDAQVEACSRLIWGYTNLFPDIKPEFPKQNGKLIKTVLIDPKNYYGILNHYHITKRKIDTIGFPFEKMEDRVKDLNVKLQSRRAPRREW